MRFQVFGLEIPRETVFGLEQRNFFLQTARDVAQLHVLTGLNAEQHLGNKVSKRFAETRGEFGGEARELGFQAGTNLARLHGGTPPWQVRIFSQKPSTTDSVPSHFCKTINPYSSNACPHLQRKTQEGPAKALHSRGSHTGRISGLGEFALRVIQYLADYAAQVRGTIGLLQIAHSTVDASRSLRIAAREQDGQLFETFAEFCSRLRASHLWHHHVQNGQRRCLGFAKAHRFFSVCGRKNAVPQADERLPGHFPDGVMVFREKKSLGAAQFDSRGLTHARSLGTASILRTNRQDRKSVV